MSRNSRKRPSQNKKDDDDSNSNQSKNSQSRSQPPKKKKSFKDRLKWKANSSFLNFWDGFMLAVITYSCFTSMYFAAIYFDICSDWIFWVENAITFFFALDIIFRFMRLKENQDPSEVTHVQIAIAYLKGSFLPDVIATIPLYLNTRYQYDPCMIVEDSGSSYTVVLKLVRLIRIKRIFALFDSKRVKKLVELLYTGGSRNKKVVFSLVMQNVYQVFKLILLTILIMYFIGCFFFLWAQFFKDQRFTFVKDYDLQHEDGFYKMLTACYFSLTTLSTVGYGDLSPKSNPERLLGMLILLGGVAFFSYIMGSFIDIISNFNQNLGNEEYTYELHNWLTLLSRFRDNKIPNSIYKQVNTHYKHYWSNDRISQISEGNEFLRKLPR